MAADRRLRADELGEPTRPVARARDRPDAARAAPTPATLASPATPAAPAVRGAHHDPPGLLQLQSSAGNAAVAGMLGRPRPGPATGTSLDPGTRSRLEAGLGGADLSDVTVSLDGAATAREGAAAFTVGSRIVVDPAHYAPGTAAGDGLLAHEAAHAVQQSDGGGPGGSVPALEAEADRAAVAVATEQTPSDGMLVRLRSALSLRRCSGCTDEEKQRLDAFRSERDPARLESFLRSASADQLRRLDEVASSSDDLHRDAIAWERAVRAKSFGDIVSLNGRSDAGFRAAYADRILDLIMAGATTLKIDPRPPEFADFVRSSLHDLLRLPSGFRLVTELIATGQTVDLRSGAGQETQAADALAGRGIGEPGARVGSGSTVTLNPELAQNQVVLGGRPGQVQIIRMDPSITVGHELIHALNNARGQNIAPPLPPEMLRTTFSGAGLVRDPVTGEPQSPEELRTATGQTSFATVRTGGATGPQQDFGPGAGISENDLRSDAGLPARASHFGATDTTTIDLGSTRTLDALVARYRLPSGAAVPTAGVAAIRAFLEADGWGRIAALADAGMTRAAVPSAEHVVMHIRFVVGNTTLADRLAGLTVR
ncbi:hypothetical protein Cch01nite_22190 [Cellulomonas chitinilytica]|uniref:eCIS core domain-containing protein n=1 Tax=Cellulomonas chitinilytica TaxID=398759 RepID=A0A919P3C2_9CELL|nr:DUF4157 domain-containing protein [Cellulomonas chitinilytica]GIG21495.1 hypothetical protein Cch01nite_22190 [Cellulomonas chitinilytica]